MKKPNYITDNDWKLLLEKYDDIDLVVKKLEEDYPVQYLIGDVNFYGYKINVNESTLIPRFETEGLVEKTINLINKYNLAAANVLEVGTGSGCISITLKKEIPSLNITAIDISSDALKVAKLNSLENHVDIEFKEEDIFNYSNGLKYDILISNPPYIDKSLTIDSKTKYEPQNAIYADNSGLIFYEHMINNYQKLLNKKFIMAFEIGEEQGEYLIELAKKTIPNANVYVEKDLSMRDRYLFIINE